MSGYGYGSAALTTKVPIDQAIARGFTRLVLAPKAGCSSSWKVGDRFSLFDPTYEFALFEVDRIHADGTVDATVRSWPKEKT